MEEKTTGAPRIALELFLLSFVSLYLELLVIRWMSADIRAFTVFRSLPLIVCFVGLGVGLALRSDALFKKTLVAVLQFAVMMKLADFFNIGIWGFPTTSVFQWQELIFAQSSALYLVAFMLLLILLLSGPFAAMVCIGSRLGVLFNEMKPLSAYCINIFGALAGGIAFPILSYLEWSPWQLLLPALAVIAWFYPRKKEVIWQSALVIGAIPFIFLLVPAHHGVPLSKEFADLKIGETKTYWSPYQRIDLSIFEAPSPQTKKNEFMGLELGVNRAFYQYFFAPNAGSLSLAPELHDVLRNREQEYDLPYKLIPAKDVLVIGAGTGQNVIAAIENGATDIDAVDIDPLILRFGRQYDQAYASSAVHLICDDARHFFGRTAKKYDVINFSLVDSHVVTGQGSSVRIDSYVYTRESIQKALSLLKPGGLIVISFNVMRPWLGERLENTLKSVVDYEPLIVTRKSFSGGGADMIFVLGESVKNKTLKLPEPWVAGKPVINPAAGVLTDDWPYLYVRNDVVDVPYLLVVVEMLLLSMFAARRYLFGKNEPINWQMFFLGAAFLLLELHAISFLSLLYGSTWITSGIVISGILLMLLLANITVIKIGDKITSRQPLIYLVLLASILFSYFLPGHQIIAAAGSADAAAYFLVTLVTVLPMGVAGILFASAFSQTGDAARSLAFNLFGALVGGLSEYLSNYTGIKNLELLAFAFYFCSMLCVWRSWKSANKNAG